MEALLCPDMNNPVVTMSYATQNRNHGLLAHKVALEGAAAALRLITTVPAPLKSLVDQVVRAAVSVPANLSEGQGRSGRDRFHHWRIAYASALELSTHLELLRGAGAVDPNQAEDALLLFDRVLAHSATTGIEASSRRFSLSVKRDGISIIGLSVFLVALALPHLLGAEPEPSPVAATLVAQVAEDDSSRLQRVGVHFQIAPGWHIYWRNPGEAGLSTLVEFDLPAKVAVDEIKWPLPNRFAQPGGIVGYGYESAVVLAADVNPVQSALPEDTEMAASASWLACRERCIQGSARLSGSLQQAVEQGRELDWGETWPQQLPRPAPHQELRVTTTGGTSPEQRTLWLSWAEAPQTVELFPAPPEELKLLPPELRSRGLTSRAELSMGLIGGATQWPQRVDAVVVAVLADGRRVGYEIVIPLN